MEKRAHSWLNALTSEDNELSDCPHGEESAIEIDD